ncbi:hypothetical protein EJB05_35603, partial [Eragrostis curvula]
MGGPRLGRWVEGMSADNIKGLLLALSSSLFIGASFIVKKKGLKKAGASGVRAGASLLRLCYSAHARLRRAAGVLCAAAAALPASWACSLDLILICARGVGGYSYLLEPLWWAGMIAMIVGEIANFAAYAFAPAILVTPLGALSIIISAVLAHIMLREKLHIFGMLGCVLCVVGSTTIVLHAPPERQIESVAEVWDLATEPAFLLYAAIVLAAAFVLIFRFVPQYGQTHIMVYIGICSLVGSLSVMSVKALGIALKLTFSGINQLVYIQTWVFLLVVISCIVTQMNYLNKALDTFNTAVVSPIYYTMFTSLTILASVIMFKDWDRQNPTQIVTEMCGFVTILSGTFLLHKTKDMADGLPSNLPIRLPKHADEDGYSVEVVPLRSAADGIPLRRKLSEAFQQKSGTTFAVAMDLSSLLLLLPFLLVGFLYLSKVRGNGGDVRRRLPPVPRGLPIIGNLHQVGALPHRALRALAAANGAPDLMRLRLGQVQALVASSPAAAAALMREHDDAFATRPYFRTADILTHGSRDLVFAPHGEHWRHVRRLCSTHVLSGARDRASASPGAVVDVSKALYGFANEVICRAVSGRVSSSREEEEGEGRRSELFRELIEENSVLLGGFCVGDYFPSLAWADDALSGAGARARRNLKRWDDLLEKVIKEHEARRRDDGGVEEQDFVDVMLALQAEKQDGYELTRDTIKALMADMFAAGTDTSFIAVEWAMSELVRNPAAMERLQREVRAAAPLAAAGVAGADALGVARTPYLRAVVKETLRLHPPAPLLLPRECMRDATVLGFHVAKGTRVFVNAWAINRDQASWQSPEDFLPERFLESEVDFRGAHFQFIPFGAGRRVCPGMQFALPTVELALANLVRLFDWELPDGAAPSELDMSDAPGLTMKRRVPLRLVAKPLG